MARDRGVGPAETGVTLFAGEAPRLVVDQLARGAVDQILAELSN